MIDKRSKSEFMIFYLYQNFNKPYIWLVIYSIGIDLIGFEVNELTT